MQSRSPKSRDDGVGDPTLRPEPRISVNGGDSWRCYDGSVRLRDAIHMLAASGVDAVAPTTWADLGCGDGTFTLALAELLAPGSTIHAMDGASPALRRIPSVHNGVRITKHRGDFTGLPWPFADLDGILMANSLHYVETPA